MPFKPSQKASREPEPEVFQGSVEDAEKPPSEDESGPLLPTLAQFLAQAAPIVGRIDKKRGAQVAGAAVATQVLSNEVDDITATGKKLLSGMRQARDKYVPMAQKALTPGFERRTIVDMHREQLSRRGGR